MILNIFNEKDKPILTSISEDVVCGERVQHIIDDLINTLKNSNTSGVGLAAPQIGFNKRIFVIKKGRNYIYFINPIVLWRSKSKVKKNEKCLSVPGFKARIERHKEITLNFCDINGSNYTNKYSGDIARIILHELDHLDGKTINNRGILVKD